MKFVNVYNDIRTILAKLDKIEKRDRKNFYSPNMYVKIFDGVELVLVYNGVYFKSSNLAALSKTLERRGISVDSRTLKRLAEDENRWCELWGLGIETHYIKMTGIEKYLCSNGTLLHKNLSPYSRTKNNYMKAELDGIIYDINLSHEVMMKFVDPDIDERDYYYLDGDYSNCGIDNLEIKNF